MYCYRDGASTYFAAQQTASKNLCYYEWVISPQRLIEAYSVQVLNM